MYYIGDIFSIMVHDFFHQQVNGSSLGRFFSPRGTKAAAPRAPETSEVTGFPQMCVLVVWRKIVVQWASATRVFFAKGVSESSANSQQKDQQFSQLLDSHDSQQLPVVIN